MNKENKCKKHGILLYSHPENGNICPQCEREMWDKEAVSIIKGFKCPVCLRPTIVDGYDDDHVLFRCEYIFDTDGEFAKTPCPVFRIDLCTECYHAVCQCEDYPQQSEREH